MNTTPAKTRVLFIDHTAERGGGEIALLRMIRNMDNDQVTPIVLLLQDGPMVPDFRAEAEVHILSARPEIVSATRGSLGWRSIFKILDVVSLLGIISKVRNQIRELDIDIVHTNSMKAHVIGGIAARLAGRRLIWHLRDGVHKEYLPPLVVTAITSLARVLPHRIITVSHAVRQALLDSAYGKSTGSAKRFAENVHTVHDGIERKDLITHYPTDAGTGTQTVGLAGRISPWKGQDVFIKSAAIVSRVLPGIKFRIIGGALFNDHAHESYLKNLTTELGLQNVVSFTGFVKDVPDQIAALDLVVHASTIAEPFGQVVIEAMAAGKPVIGSNAGGVPEVIVDGVTGVLTPPGDEHLLANAIIRLMESPDMRERFGRAGLQRVEEMFLIEKTCREVQALYEQILPNNRQHVLVPAL